jgi:hypothetical protein
MKIRSAVVKQVNIAKLVAHFVQLLVAMAPLKVLIPTFTLIARPYPT